MRNQNCGARGSSDPGQAAASNTIVGIIPVICPGDFNDDGVTDFDDLNIVLSGWDLGYDFDDLNAVVANWNNPCGP